MDIDKPLDEIIDQKRSERRSSRGRGRGRGAARGGGPARGAGAAAASTGPVRNKHTGSAAAAGAAGPAASAPAKPVIPLMADGSKIQVSNLPTDVTDNQIRELFSQTVGPVTRVSLVYDKHGKSTGTANIDFKRPADAQNAFNSYNTRLVDGNKPMKVEIIFDPSRLPPPPLNSRIAPAIKSPVSASPTTPTGPTRGAARGGKPAGRGGRGRGRGGRKADDRPKPTEADLDAEMEDYQKKLAA
ncbi:hypothetical protein P389DRAFT_166082 [Cystobasidium minutum MCA 4210]|uniref:uncharacterized protein n=1 Tax=Cystobasidium minutum MCA 4210 TaxID=1397322 RepID=UPI0034CE289E|eukprot:jgi/Rhomi1/166082/fgenesh1_kg.1_\